MHQIYLSRRNLLTLLSKLDRRAAGEKTHCTIIKRRNPGALDFVQTMPEVAVIVVDKIEEDLQVMAIEDEVFYAAQQRPAGGMLPVDEAKIGKPSTGIAYRID